VVDNSRLEQSELVPASALQGGDRVDFVDAQKANTSYIVQGMTVLGTNPLYLQAGGNPAHGDDALIRTPFTILPFQKVGSELKPSNEGRQEVGTLTVMGSQNASGKFSGPLKVLLQISKPGEIMFTRVRPLEIADLKQNQAVLFAGKNQEGGVVDLTELKVVPNWLHHGA
jgi:hypothetical protein